MPRRAVVGSLASNPQEVPLPSKNSAVQVSSSAPTVPDASRSSVSVSALRSATATWESC
jgi:hypothetical protein